MKWRRALVGGIFLLILASLPLGCGGDHRNDLSRILATYGPPEDTDATYAPDGIHTLTIWYWSKGKGFEFVERSYISMRGLECVERYYWELKKEYTFTPVPPTEKEKVEELKRKLRGGTKIE